MDSLISKFCLMISLLGILGLGSIVLGFIPATETIEVNYWGAKSFLIVLAFIALALHFNQVAKLKNELIKVQCPDSNQTSSIINRRKHAFIVLQALLQNPERYKYISRLVGEKQLSNDDATQKNIEKAYKIVDQFNNFDPPRAK